MRISSGSSNCDTFTWVPIIVMLLLKYERNLAFVLKKQTKQKKTLNSFKCEIRSRGVQSYLQRAVVGQVFSPITQEPHLSPLV